MNRSPLSPEMLALAEELMIRESALQSAGATTGALFAVSEKLCRILGGVIGGAGFRALMVRALALTRKQLPALNMIEIDADGSLRFAEPLDFDRNSSHYIVDGNQASEASTLLVAHLLTLFTSFIGSGLTLNLVLKAWPDLPVSVLELWRTKDHDPAR